MVEIYKDYDDYLRNTKAILDKYKGEVGCTIMFSGYVRSYHIVNGKKVDCEGMSIYVDNLDKILENIGKKAIEKYGILNVIIYHNLGDLKVGDTIVSYFILGRQRYESYEALKYIVEEIKKYH